VGNWSRFVDVFSLNFSDLTPLNFVQLNFWIFFIAIFAAYSILELPKKQKAIAFYAVSVIGLIIYNQHDIAVLLGVVGLGIAFYLEKWKIDWHKWAAIGAIATIGLAYVVFRYVKGNFTIQLSAFDLWILFIAAVFLLARYREKFWVRSFFLTAVSLFFYYKSSGFFVLLLGASLIVNFFIGKWVYTAKTNKKIILAIGVVFNLLILVYFKYAYFFTDAFNTTFSTNLEVFNHFAHWANGFAGEGTFVERILLPVGVSFFTFQSISYSVDIYRKEINPVNSFFDYAFFVTFFPQLVAGPIVRAKHFIPQIRQEYELDNADFSWAIIQVVKGLIKKIVLADYIAIHFIDHVAAAPETFPGFVSVLAMWGYSLQIYGDFSGYTDIAIGLSRLMGFKLHENFNSPYKATSVADFWRRWHKSLGSWLRDYLYIPLGGNRRGGIGTYIVSTIIFIFLIFITKWYALIFVYIGMLILYAYGWMFIKNFNRLVHRDLNLLITMIIGGLWHGASRNFVIWGAMNGAALVIYKYWKKISPYENETGGLSRFWKIFITFNFITFTRIWFRLEGDTQPMVMLNQITQHFDFSWTVFIQVISNYWTVFVLLIVGFTLHWLPSQIKKGWENHFEKLSMPLKIVTVSILLFLVYQTAVDGGKPFVYFQF
jgi:D-alanyl-lipoteichoic acid acyltransferase DltB (MBOAT superfamily)